MVVRYFALVARLSMWSTKVSFLSSVNPRYLVSFVKGIAWLNSVRGRSLALLWVNFDSPLCHKIINSLKLKGDCKLDVVEISVRGDNGRFIGEGC